MRVRMLALMGLLVLSTSAIAQNQNSPNSAQYHAIRNPNSPYSPYSDAQQSNQQVVRWADRWGAIAGDGDGTYGIVADMPSKQEAQRAAIAECGKRAGSASCHVRLAYYNQCAAVGASTTNSFSSSAETVEEAQQRAMRRCEEASGKGTCWVYYSGCSLPVQVR